MKLKYDVQTDICYDSHRLDEWGIVEPKKGINLSSKIAPAGFRKDSITENCDRIRLICWFVNFKSLLSL